MRNTLVLAVVLWVQGSTLAAQGPVQNRAADIFFGPDVFDARALWVNPASLGVGMSASVMADLTSMMPFEDGGRVSQWTLGLASRGFSFGYQHDEFSLDGARDAYRFGFGGGVAPLTVGAAVTFYRGIGKGVGWDIGAMYQAGRYFVLSGVLANIGQPDLGQNDEFNLPATLKPAAMLNLLDGRLGLAAGGAFSSDSVHFIGAGVRLAPAPGVPLTAMARFDAVNGEFDQGQFTFTVSWGVRGLLQGSLSTPQGLDSVGLLSLTGVAVQPLNQPRR